jgi:microcystin-dependent protein
MSTPYIGQLQPVAFNFAPNGWALCQGQTLSISSNAALFALIGTAYGGNGTTNFNLPDLRGRVPKGVGSGAGLAAYAMGEIGGVESVVVLSTQMPAHTHPLPAASGLGTTDVPTGAVPAAGGSYASTANAALSPSSSSGTGLPVPILTPYATINWIICLDGTFPSAG